MTEYQVRKEIKMLLTEEENLRKSIIDLEEKLSHKSSSSKYNKKCNTATRTDVTQNENLSNQRKWLKLSQKLNRINFINEEITLLDDGSSQCVATGVIDSIGIHISLKIQDQDGQEMIIRSLNVKFMDPFQEKELKSWINRCMRENDLQIVIKGLVSYAEWYNNREYIINWMKVDYDVYYTIEKSYEDGDFNIITKVKKYNMPLFTCKWSILWKQSSSSMFPSFTFRLKKNTKFFKENEYLFKKLSSPEVTPDAAADMWRRISLSIMTTRDSENVTSESESEI